MDSGRLHFQEVFDFVFVFTFIKRLVSFLFCSMNISSLTPARNLAHTVKVCDFNSAELINPINPWTPSRLLHFYYIFNKCVINFIHLALFLTSIMADFMTSGDIVITEQKLKHCQMPWTLWVLNQIKKV